MLAGLISKEQSISAWGDPDRILAALAPYSLDKPRDIWAADRQMLLQVATGTGSTSAEIYRHPESGVAVAFWGRLDNRADLIAQLEAEHKSSDEALIALAWLKWGEYCPEKLIGDFAFAVASPSTGVVFLARDVMGVKPLYYRADEHGVFFANSASAFKPLTLGLLTRSREWMAKYLIYCSTSHAETAYVEIKKLPSAHCVLIDASGQLNIRRYHQFQDDSTWESRRDPKWLEAYREIWRESVACRIPVSGDIGAENSGGIDSGSITSEIAMQLGADIGRLNCFGYCRQEQEPDMIMATAMKYGIHRTFLSSRSFEYQYLENVLARSIAVNGYPIEIGVAEEHAHFFENCQQSSIETLFSGFGGDELVTHDGAIGLAELLDRSDYINVFRMTTGDFARRVYRTGKLVARGYRIPRVWPSDVDAFQQRMQSTFFTDEIEAEFGLKRAFIHQNDYGQEFRKLNSMALFDVSKSYVPTRLENCTLLASSFGVDYVWPLLDSRLMQQWLSTPTLWKIGDGWMGRYLHRCAVDGVCPSKVTWKPDKNMGFKAIHGHFEQRCNRDLFSSLLGMAEGLPAWLESVVDVSRLKRMASNGIKDDSRGYQLHSALIMLDMNLRSLTAWEDV